MMEPSSRLRWQCRRGTLELDLVLNRFVESGWAQLTARQRDAFEALLGYPDAVLLECVMDRLTPMDPVIADVISKIRESAAR